MPDEIQVGAVVHLVCSRFDSDGKTVEVVGRDTDSDGDTFIHTDKGLNLCVWRFCRSPVGHLDDPCIFCGQNWKEPMRSWMNRFEK